MSRHEMENVELVVLTFSDIHSIFFSHFDNSANAAAPFSTHLLGVGKSAPPEITKQGFIFTVDADGN